MTTTCLPSGLMATSSGPLAVALSGWLPSAIAAGPLPAARNPATSGAPPAFRTSNLRGPRGYLNTRTLAWAHSGASRSPAGMGRSMTLLSGARGQVQRLSYRQRRVVQEVQVDDEGPAGRAEIGAFGRIEQKAAAAVAGSASRRVTERQEQATAVLIQPPQRHPLTDGIRRT